MPYTRPHFLHVGPERTATTWLYRMLGQHPDVYVNPVKEIRYFFEAHAYPGEGLLERFRDGDWHNEFYRDYLKGRLKFCVRHPLLAARSTERLKWDCKFLFGRRSDEWFDSLFRSEDSKVTGDFSVQTYRLPPEEIVRISREWPDMKVLFGMRDPVEWTWSYASMSLFFDREPADVSEPQFLNHFRKNAAEFPTVSSISVWEQAFAGRFKILFYDDIAQDSASALLNVCEFLGIETEPIANIEDVSRRVYPGPTFAMPTHYRRMLIEIYKDNMRELADAFGGHPRRWLERYSESPQASG